MKKKLYILIIIFVSIQASAQKVDNKYLTISSTNNSFSILPEITAFAPDFIEESLSPKKNEYMYWGLRLGISNGFSGQPELNNNKYLDNIPLGSNANEMLAVPVDSYIGYVPGFVADLFFHYDFVTENAGIFTGIEYNYYGMASKYETKTGAYSAVEKNTVNAIGVPLAFKFGQDFYKQQAYIYTGIKYSFNLSMTSVQKVSWESGITKVKVDAEQINRSNFGLFFGVNYTFFNLQFDYIPGNFLNSNYKTSSGYIPALGQPDKLFFISASLNAPLNGWIGTKSRTLKKFFKKLKFWR